MAMRYQSSMKKSDRKFEVVGARRLAVHSPLPLVDLREELQPQGRTPSLAGRPADHSVSG
jgi:hypothetical protein